MTKLRVASSRSSRLVTVGIWIAGLAGVGGIFAMVLIAIEKVRTGRGLDTYRTHWMVEFNWVGFLIFLAAIAVALAIGLLFRFKEWREIRKLQDKYSGEHHG
jgi:hypothetical protein